jgi:hypothetical protein
VNNSTIYTIGTVLDRARDSGIPVDVLAEGQWFTGRVMLVDGHGVVLDTDDRGYAVIRVANISVVRVSDPTMACSGAPWEVPAAATPMPAAGY